MTLYHFSYAASAEADLKSLYDYLAERVSEAVAGNYINRIQDACESLAHTPLRGTIRAEFGRGVRTIGFERRATIVFRVDRKARRVVVLGVAYGGRRLGVEEE